MLTWEELIMLSRITTTPGAPPGWKPRYNAAPTQRMPVVRIVDDKRELALLRWGLIPSWAKDPKIGNSLINARGETVAEKPAFRSAFKARRCLVLVDGFYEWRKLPGGGKQPYRITMADGSPFAFAGLWERWDKGDEPLETFTIITTTANELVVPIHDRMPVILDPADYDAWLESPDTAIPMALIQPYPARRMSAYPVSTRVNSPRNDDAAVIERVSA
jgi:putative SOS response-associated peptidase YedK